MSGKIKKELENEKAVLQCAEKFGLIGDPTRMKICWLLCRHPELSVGEIADMLHVSVSVVSHALKKLRKNELVDSRREHKTIFYKLTNTDFTKMVKKTLTNI
ncbi:MAG: metalloregulator ArsR/SmtB family transcription factor [Candidatus Paceibacterota bacterium]